MKTHTKRLLTDEYRRLTTAINWLLANNWGKLTLLNALLVRKRRLEQRLN